MLSRLGIPLGGACNKEYSIWAVETALLGNAYMALHLRPKHLVRTSAEPGMDDCLVVRLVQDLQAGDRREQAVDQLSDLAAESLHDFTQNATERARPAPVLWSSFGTVSILINEVVQVYSNLATPATLTAASLARAEAALGVFIYMACHSETRLSLLSAGMPELLYPILHAFITDHGVNQLRGSALLATVMLFRHDNSEISGRILRSEIVPLCLQLLVARPDSCLNSRVSLPQIPN